jgi:hypothetical protein
MNIVGEAIERGGEMSVRKQTTSGWTLRRAGRNSDDARKMNGRVEEERTHN